MAALLRLIFSFLLLVSAALAGTEGVFNGLVGTGEIGSGSASEQKRFSAKNGFIALNSAANGGFTGTLRLEGKLETFSGAWNSGNAATVTVARAGRTPAVLALQHSGTVPGEVSGTVTAGGVALSFRALRGDYWPAGGSHVLGGKRYSILLPPPAGAVMGIGVATLFVGTEGLASLSGWMPNGQSFATFSRVVDDGSGHWVMPVYVASAGVLTGELEIAQDAPASGSEVGGTLAWLKPAASAGAGGGFLKEIFPVGTFHAALDSKLSTGLGGGAFTLTLKAGAGALSGDAVQNGTWPSSGKPVWEASTLSGLSIGFTAPNGQFSGAFSVGKKGTYKGLLLSREVQLKDGTVVRGGGFYVRGTGTGAVLITSSAPAADRPGSNSGVGLGMVSVLGGTMPGGSALAGQVVGDFSIGKTEVTWGEWKTVREWAVANGYSDLANVGAGRGDNYPVTNVSWYDVVKWCNAKSEKEGKVPVYQVSGATYKSREFGWNGPGVVSQKAGANGYRLPTELEWEWAARGGRQTHGYRYSGSNDSNAVAWTYENSNDGTKAVGTKSANELGIFDMSGNVWEWCWDLYSSGIAYRRIRGGGWGHGAGNATMSYRSDSPNPDGRYFSFGFRLACSSGL